MFKMSEADSDVGVVVDKCDVQSSTQELSAVENVTAYFLVVAHSDWLKVFCLKELSVPRWDFPVDSVGDAFIILAVVM